MSGIFEVLEYKEWELIFFISEKLTENKKQKINTIKIQIIEKIIKIQCK